MITIERVNEYIYLTDLTTNRVYEGLRHNVQLNVLDTGLAEWTISGLNQWDIRKVFLATDTNLGNGTALKAWAEANLGIQSSGGSIDISTLATQVTLQEVSDKLSNLTGLQPYMVRESVANTAPDCYSISFFNNGNTDIFINVGGVPNILKTGEQIEFNAGNLRYYPNGMFTYDATGSELILTANLV